ncbi:MAG: RtcB family protein [Promethearchaeia archaeon]
MEVRKVGRNIYEIPPKVLMARLGSEIHKFKMRVPVHIFANEYILQRIKKDRTLDQISNVACLPGVHKHVIALSDAHQGYGFCIGGVAATDGETGCVSPGGVGFDINCGVRLLRTNLHEKDVQKQLPVLLTKIFQYIPSGLGSRGKLRISKRELNYLLSDGMNWALQHEYAIEEDLEHCEEHGCMTGADADLVSRKAKHRGIKQVGSLGSGNHFLEIQKVEQIYDKKIANRLGIYDKKQITVMIHTGSRAMGHQICTDSLRNVEKAMKAHGIKVPDRELSCVPANTPAAQNYMSQMACAANFGFCNRQLITHWVRKAFQKTFKKPAEEMDINLIYGVCHNILKKEEHDVGGKTKIVNVHRKGATRAFPPEHPKIPKDYKRIGQPVLIPGTMGSSSYLCVGQPNSMELSFGSTAHGSGRVMSRSRAKRKYWGENVANDLGNKGILVKAASMRVVAEEAPGAYKDIDQVVNVSHNLGIIKKVVRLLPLGVVKG